jgi:hypothetical protein
MQHEVEDSTSAVLAGRSRRVFGQAQAIGAAGAGAGNVGVKQQGWFVVAGIGSLVRGAKTSVHRIPVRSSRSGP